jgi:hypothetical protein
MQGSSEARRRTALGRAGRIVQRWARRSSATVLPAVRARLVSSLAVQLAGACSNPEAGVELRLMTKVTAAIERANARSEAAPDRCAPPPRPGWVTDLVIRVLAKADSALTPHEVHGRAEVLRARPISRSSIRNALRIVSSEKDSAIERVAFGSYQLRSRAAS